MNILRYNWLNFHGGPLTQGEIEEGWHFCPDWDGLLVGPRTYEEDACTCKMDPNMKFDKERRK